MSLGTKGLNDSLPCTDETLLEINPPSTYTHLYVHLFLFLVMGLDCIDLAQDIRILRWRVDVNAVMNRRVP